MMSARRQRQVAAAAIGAAVLLSFGHLFSGWVIAGRDLYRLFIPETAYLRERLLLGELPLWVARERLGQPFAALIYTQVFYPPRLLFALAFGGVWGTNLLIAFHAALASCGAVWASRRLGAGPLSSLVAATFGLTPFFMRLGEMAHAISALAWSGPILVAALALARSPSLPRAAWLALALGASAACGAPELLLWQGALVLLAALWSARPALALAWLLFAGAWAVVLSAVVFLPAAELAFAWARPGEVPVDRLLWSTSWPQLLAPAMLFVDTPREKLVDQWFVTSLFIGAVPCLLALASVRRPRKVNRALPLVVLAVACAVLSLGGHFAPSAWLMGLPPFSLFRYPVKYFFGSLFAVAVLAPLGLGRLAALARKRSASVRAALFTFAGGMLALGVVVKLAGLVAARSGFPAGVFWLGTAALAMAVLWTATPNGRARGRRVRAGLVVLAGLELVSGRMLVPKTLVEAKNLTSPSHLAELVRAQPHGRLSILEEDGDVPDSALEGGGPSPIELSRENMLGLRYLEEQFSIPEGYGFRDPWRLTDAMEGGPRGAYDFFGVTHYLRAAGPPFPDLELVPTTGGWMQVYRSTTALPRAFVVHFAEVVPDAVALAAVRNDAQSLRQRVLLATGEPVAATGPCDSKATISEDHEERLRIDVDACADGYLVLTDTWDPGWEATVDDRPATIHRADALVRAVAVPKGTHAVCMQYRPRSFQIGAALSALALAAVAFAWVRGRRRGPER